MKAQNHRKPTKLAKNDLDSLNTETLKQPKMAQAQQISPKRSDFTKNQQIGPKWPNFTKNQQTGRQWPKITNKTALNH